MKSLLIISMMVMMLCAGCAAPTKFNISNSDDFNILSAPHAATYSSYVSKIEFNDEDKFHHLNVYVGGRGRCDDGVILYAKPKLDDFMKENKFTSYTIVKGEYTLFPLSKCELFTQFVK